MNEAVDMTDVHPDSHYLIKLDGANISADQVADALERGGIKADKLRVTKLRGNDG